MGDTYGSNRFMDILLSGTVLPILTSVQQYHILPKFYLPVIQNVSYFIPLNSTSSYNDFASHIDGLMRVSQSEYDLKIQMLSQYRDLFDYTTGIPFDRYTAEFWENLK